MIIINKIRLYPNGFILSEKQFDNIPEYYKVKEILNRYYYHYDENSQYNLTSEEDHFIIIHGHYIYLDSDYNEKNDELPGILLEAYKFDYDRFLNLLDYIGGRYIIIIGNKEKVEFYPDATAARTTYYSLKENIASSHVNLINDLIPHTKDNLAEKAELLKYHWNTTPYSDIKSINPNFKIELLTKSRERFFPRQENKYTALNHDERLIIISSLWENQVDYYCNNFKNIIFSLSGGADSRVSLAMVKNYLDGLKFFTYTTTEGENYKDQYTSVLSNDQYIVKQMQQDLKLNHEFFYFDQKRFALSKEEKNIISKNTVKQHGRFLINFYLSSFPESEVMHMRGTPLEVGQGYFLARDRNNTVREVEKTFNHNMSKYRDEISQELLNELFNNSVEVFNYNDDLYNYHKLDLYYWENRMGRWHSEILNENDICFETIMPFNMRAMIDVSLAYNRVQRREGYVFNELINKHYPVLNFYGKNTKLNLYEQNKIDNDDDKNIFNSFDVCNENGIIRTENTNNIIYIPFRDLSRDTYSTLSYKFKKTTGILEINLLSKYYNKKALGYLKYQILKNNKILLEEDISKWNLKTKITIFNLNFDDLITIRVLSLKNIVGESWEDASRLEILDLKEIGTKKKSPITVISDSPFSNIY